MRARAIAHPQGSRLFLLPPKAFVFDVIFQPLANLKIEHNQRNTASLGIAGDREHFTKKTQISGGHVVHADLGKGAGYQAVEREVMLYWNYNGGGNPTSGEMFVLMVFDLS